MRNPFYAIYRDFKACFERDPAARTPFGALEVIFLYSGLHAVLFYRCAHVLYQLRIPFIPRLISQIARFLTGVEIHPGAQIAPGFFIDHGTGVVIGETTTIGDNVKLYQGVTLGAKSFSLDESGNPVKGIPRHPIVEDNVVVYSNASILGRITIGHDSVIGGNIWITNDLPPYSRIVQNKAKTAEFIFGGGI